MSWKGPLSGRYWAAALLVLAALMPYLALSSALEPLLKVLGPGVHLSSQGLSLATGMANAGYAMGTVLSLQLAQRLPQRRMLIVYASLFVIGSLLAATAPTPGLFIAGHVLQGLCTSLMLVAAVPPLAAGWPASKLPSTVVVLGMGIFGAVAAGPVIGGIQADAHGWRPLFWIVAGIGVFALLMAFLTFSDDPPVDPDRRIDWISIVLAGLGASSAFFGASELETHAMLDPIAILPMVIGAVLIIALAVYEFFADEPLISVRKLCTTIPVAGTVVAMSAGAASVAVIELAQTAYATRGSPLHVAFLFWPELGGALVTSFLFGTLLRTRLLPGFAMLGMLVLIGGAAILTGVSGGPELLVIVGSGLVGLGVGASVSPALVIAGFALLPTELQSIYALLELLRGMAAFLAAPIILHLSTTTGATPGAGIENAVWATLAIAAIGSGLTLAIALLGRLPVRIPDIDTWIEAEAPALQSPPLAAAIRGRHDRPAGRGRSQPRRRLTDGQ